MDYKRYELKEQKGYKWINLDKNKTLTGIHKRYKAKVSDEKSAFKNYANSDSISDIKVKGFKALQYLKQTSRCKFQGIPTETKGNENSFRNL